MAKIFFIGWINVKYLPIKLALPILEQILFGHVKSKLIPTLLQTLAENDKQILSAALTDITTVEEDDLIDALSSLECRVIPKSNNLAAILEELAHKELIQKPRFIIEQFRSELIDVAFLSEENFSKLHKSMEPTAKNILNILSCIATTKEEFTTFRFLKKFIRETTDDNRLKFLRFSTGAVVITDNRIKVDFTSVTGGLARTPMAHTCSGILQLPSKYEYFADFRKEFNNLLSSNIWVMDIV